MVEDGWDKGRTSSWDGEDKAKFLHFVLYVQIVSGHFAQSKGRATPKIVTL